MNKFIIGFLLSGMATGCRHYSSPDSTPEGFTTRRVIDCKVEEQLIRGYDTTLSGEHSDVWVTSRDNQPSRGATAVVGLTKYVDGTRGDVISFDRNLPQSITAHIWRDMGSSGIEHRIINVKDKVGDMYLSLEDNGKVLFYEKTAILKCM